MLLKSPELYAVPYSYPEARRLTRGAAFVCASCRRVLVSSSTFTTGYGTAGKRRHCFDCCGEREEVRMMKTGRACLYLEIRGQEAGAQPRAWHVGRLDGTVSNWPGTLKFAARVSQGRHNIARTRYDVRFGGPCGSTWSGVQYGENTTLVRYRMVKSR